MKRIKGFDINFDLEKIADNVKIEVSRGAVSQVLEKGDTPEDEQQK